MPGAQNERPGSLDEARHEEIVCEYPRRVREINGKLGTPGCAGGGSRVPVPIAGAIAGVLSDVDVLAGVTAMALAAHIQFFSTSAVEAGGMYKQRVQKAWCHAARQEWIGPLLDCRKGLIGHGPRATRSASGKTVTRSSSGTATTALTSLSSSMPAPPTGRASEAPLPYHTSQSRAPPSGRGTKKRILCCGYLVYG